MSANPSSLADRLEFPEKKEEKKEEETPAAEGDAKEDESNLVANKYEVAVRLADLQGDPNSPLYSVKNFEDLGL